MWIFKQFGNEHEATREGKRKIKIQLLRLVMVSNISWSGIKMDRIKNKTTNEINCNKLLQITLISLYENKILIDWLMSLI